MRNILDFIEKKNIYFLDNINRALREKIKCNNSEKCVTF